MSFLEKAMKQQSLKYIFSLSRKRPYLASPTLIISYVAILKIFSSNDYAAKNERYSDLVLSLALGFISL